MEVHFIVPEGIDDPARPSGGNTYDRRVAQGLADLGWIVHEHDISALAELPDGAVVLLDGLIASPAPDVLVPHARRLRQVVLMHMPIDDAREHAVLEAATAVITTSDWTRRRLGEVHGLPAEHVHVAEPGVDIGDLAPGTTTGEALLCVAAVTRHKGHDVLLDALATATELPWRCTCVGNLDRDPEWAERVRDHGLGDRVDFTGARTGRDLDRTYAAADLLVLASRAETYGMVVTEALARGVPVVATDVGGVREALGGGRTARPVRRPSGARYRAARLARRRRAARAAATGRAGAALDAAPVGRHGGGRRRGPRRGARRHWSGAMSALVSPAWLDLREPADAAARSTELAERLAQHLPAGPLEIHDLGGGSGSMGRWLAPRLSGPQHWVVHDRDPDLLELAVADPPDGATVEARQSDVGALGDLAGADLVVASALLDILTADELRAMLGACAGRPMLLALTVVGRVALTPAEPLDARFAAAFNAHQRRGGLLGPDAVANAVGTVASLVRPSPWHLDAAHADLVDRVARRVGRRRVRAGARAGRRGRGLPGAAPGPGGRR